MTIHAYPEMHLSKAQTSLGDAFDYAINTCGIPGEDFLHMFAVSPTGRRLERGEYACLLGKSGIELAREILSETLGRDVCTPPEDRMTRSEEYWIGWALCYYQWRSGRKYMEILQAITFDELKKMYLTLHEADVTKFADALDRRMQACYPETNLKRFRTIYGCTQAELAERSGVSLRSIQMYEQRQKDINRASAETVLRLAVTLHCSMEDLVER